jgi:hypothetical protein
LIQVFYSTKRQICIVIEDLTLNNRWISLSITVSKYYAIVNIDIYSTLDDIVSNEGWISHTINMFNYFIQKSISFLPAYRVHDRVVDEQVIECACVCSFIQVGISSACTKLKGSRSTDGWMSEFLVALLCSPIVLDEMLHIYDSWRSNTKQLINSS